MVRAAVPGSYAPQQQQQQQAYGYAQSLPQAGYDYNYEQQQQPAYSGYAPPPQPLYAGGGYVQQQQQPAYVQLPPPEPQQVYYGQQPPYNAQQPAPAAPLPDLFSSLVSAGLLAGAPAVTPAASAATAAGHETTPPRAARGLSRPETGRPPSIEFTPDKIKVFGEQGSLLLRPQLWRRGHASARHCRHYLLLDSPICTLFVVAPQHTVRVVALSRPTAEAGTLKLLQHSVNCSTLACMSRSPFSALPVPCHVQSGRQSSPMHGGLQARHGAGSAVAPLQAEVPALLLAPLTGTQAAPADTVHGGPTTSPAKMQCKLVHHFALHTPPCTWAHPPHPRRLISRPPAPPRAGAQPSGSAPPAAPDRGDQAALPGRQVPAPPGAPARPERVAPVVRGPRHLDGHRLGLGRRGRGHRRRRRRGGDRRRAPA